MTHPRPDIAILGYGTSVINAAEAIDQLAGDYTIDLYDARFAKPVDLDLVRSLVERSIPILTIEDHGIEGGFGSCVIDSALDAGIDVRGIHRIGLPCRWIYQGSRAEQLAEAGIDANGIARTVRRVLDPGAEQPVVETLSRETPSSPVPSVRQ